MQCPVCNDTKLTMTQRQGIEIDYCPDCRGIWLDRGELDKIIERTMGEGRSAGGSAGGGGFGDKTPDHGKHKKRGSLLGELFDF